MAQLDRQFRKKFALNKTIDYFAEEKIFSGRVFFQAKFDNKNRCFPSYRKSKKAYPHLIVINLFQALFKYVFFVMLK